MMGAFMTNSAPLCSKPCSSLGGSRAQNKSLKYGHWPHTHVGLVFLAINDAQQGGSLVVFEVKSHVIHSFYCKTKKPSWSSRDSCCAWPGVRVCVPVPFRQCSVVVNPLVRGSRWYLSWGRPLLSATCILIWCFFSVKRVPSQYSRNCGGQRRALLREDQSQRSEMTSHLMSYVKLKHAVSMNRNANTMSAERYSRGFACR